MFKDDIFEKWLDDKANEIVKDLGEGKSLTTEEMMILVLKAQTNHFAHLDIELREDMKALREDVARDMKELREDVARDMKELREDVAKDMKALREDVARDMRELREDMDKRFEQVDKRFEQVDKRFEQVDRRFEQVIGRMDRFMVWSLGLTITSTFFILGFMYKLIG